MTPDQEAELVGGGISFLHTHVTTQDHDQLRRFQQLEKVRQVSTGYTALPEDDILLVNSSSGAITIQLLPANAGQHLIVTRIAGGNSVTLLPAPGDTINGASSVVISVSNSPQRLKAIRGLGYIEI